MLRVYYIITNHYVRHQIYNSQLYYILAATDSVEPRERYSHEEEIEIT